VAIHVAWKKEEENISSSRRGVRFRKMGAHLGKLLNLLCEEKSTENRAHRQEKGIIGPPETPLVLRLRGSRKKSDLSILITAVLLLHTSEER